MLEDARLDGDVVHESPVEAIEIGDDEAAVLFFDFGVTARHGSIGDGNISGGFATNHERVFAHGEDRSF